MLRSHPAGWPLLLLAAFIPDKTYSGLVANDKMFKTANGKSFKCKSESQFLMSSTLQVKLVPLQLQAFTLNNGKFGKGGRTLPSDCAEMLKHTQLVSCSIFKP
ncbi:unnamed protein product [Tetraodon nigroviridis]|uniref:Chromosome undetermined SCAF14243, whole genome shotgun sequence n=1 Tax=Tetraodon nigroviridis TaxID=99883 RepID=Q4STD7_TETNG|nr:unnamed protein product [Tetraodon nigroviridis]